MADASSLIVYHVFLLRVLRSKSVLRFKKIGATLFISFKLLSSKVKTKNEK